MGRRPASSAVSRSRTSSRFIRIASDPGLLLADRRSRTRRLAGILLFGAVVATDWVDGTIARRTGQVSELGKVLDPVADRLAIAAGLIALMVRGAFPFWAGARDPRSATWSSWSPVPSLLFGQRHVRVEVRWIGKVATFSLMTADPDDLVGEPRAVRWATPPWSSAGSRLRARASSSTTWPPRSTSETHVGSALLGERRGAAADAIVCGSPAGERRRRGIEEASGGVPGGPSVHEGARVGAARRRPRPGRHHGLRAGRTRRRRLRRSPRGRASRSRPTSPSARSSRRSRSPTSTARSRGTIVERNPLIDERPELVNEQPYGDGWLVVIEPVDAGAVDALLDAQAYRGFLDSSS